MDDQDPVARGSQRMLALTADIVSAYVTRNPVQPGDLSGLLKQVHETLHTLNGTGDRASEQSPAVAPNKSITDDYLICLEDGEKFKSLKRHLRSKYDLTPDAYREKWALPSNYPMVAPAYARKRSKLAKEMGLGRQNK